MVSMLGMAKIVKMSGVFGDLSAAPMATPVGFPAALPPASQANAAEPEQACPAGTRGGERPPVCVGVVKMAAATKPSLEEPLQCGRPDLNPRFPDASPLWPRPWPWRCSRCRSGRPSRRGTNRERSTTTTSGSSRWGPLGRPIRPRSWRPRAFASSCCDRPARTKARGSRWPSTPRAGSSFRARTRACCG